MPSRSSAATARYKEQVENAKKRAYPLRIASAARGELKSRVQSSLDRDGVVILPPMEIEDSFALVESLEPSLDAVMLDPWYNKGFGGMQDDYLNFFLKIIDRAGKISRHVYFWGFPEVVAPFVERIPEPLKLTCWLTWYYKNNPSVIRGWRSSQNACLHLSQDGAVLFPQRFLNGKQLNLLAEKKLRYMPGPTSVLEGQPDDVIEEPLLVGFVGRAEQTGHPSQKPLRVYDDLLKMVVSEKGLIFDPMAGSGTAGAVAQKRDYRAILCDRSEEFTQLMEQRVQISRLDLSDLIVP
jgi:site-specific DNA-methyltransferase (adenine-specific)